MGSEDFSARPAGGVLLIVAIILIAFNLRIVVTSIGPVLRDIVADAGLSAFGASVLTTLPSMCFGVAAFTAPGLARRIGPERVVLLTLVMVAFGTVSRAPAHPLALYSGQILATFGIGVVNTLLPGIVKRDFPGRVAALTGLYTMSFCLGAAIAAGATAPLAEVFGSWSAALAFWTLPTLLAIVVWIWCLPRKGATTATPRFAVRGLWRDSLAWNVTFFMGLLSALAYLVFGWVSPILRDRGMAPVDAGFMLSVTVVVQAATCLFAPALATRGQSQSWFNVCGMMLGAASILGIIYGPLSSAWIWSALLGVSMGMTIAVALTIIVLRSGDSHVAAQLSGMVMGIGYLISSLGPLLTGLLRSWTGGWDAVALFAMAICAGAAIAGWSAGQPRVVKALVEPVPGRTVDLPGS